MTELAALLEIIQKGGILAAALALAYAIHKKFIVPGWAYNDCVAANATCRETVSQHALRSEARLDKLEAERDKSHAAPTS